MRKDVKKKKPTLTWLGEIRKEDNAILGERALFGCVRRRVPSI